MAGVTFPRVISQKLMVSLEYLDKPYEPMLSEQAEGFIKGILATNNAASVVFKNIVLAYTSISELNSSDNIRLGHGVGMLRILFPLTAEQFLPMLQFEGDDQWSAVGEYVNKLSQERVSHVSS